MPEDINELDVTDAGLKAIMGNRFHDETMKEVNSKKETTTVKTEKSAHKPTHDFKDGKWEPIKNRTWMDSLKSAASWLVGFAGLSFLVFYWMEAGLMDESIAVPSIAVCTALAGFGVGLKARSK
jgi:hypothetical protein